MAYAIKRLVTFCVERLSSVPPKAGVKILFNDVDIFFVAHIFKDFRPDGSGDLAEVCLFQEEHKGAGLSYASADTEGELVIQDALMIGQLHKIELVGNFELHFERIGVDADTHTCQLVAPFSDRVPDEDIAVEAVGIPAGF